MNQEETNKTDIRVIYKSAEFEVFYAGLSANDYLWKRLTHLKTVNYLSLHYN